MSETATQTPILEMTLGIHRIAEHISELIVLGEQIVKNGPSNTAPCCAWDAGSLSRRLSTKPTVPHQAILIDMGGTHTKVAVKHPSGEWSLLFDYLNDWFESKRDSSLPLLQGFFRILVQEIAASLPSLTTENLPLRVGVIWSNQIKTKRFTADKTTGVTGIVHGYQSGGYRKGEWFLKGIKNGDDIGALLLAAFSYVSITPDVMVLGNDTLFTLFAAPGAHAGVVMSSGGNCTLVGTCDDDRDELYNSELGGMFMLPSALLSLGDQAFAKSRKLTSLSLEELCAGNWFPHMVTAHITTAATLPEGQTLIPLAAAIQKGELTINNRALCDLIAGDAGIFSAFPQSSIDSLTPLVVALVTRGAILAGLMTYLSVVPQLRAGERHALISLDSSMARYFPGYFDTMKSFISSITPAGCSIDLALIHPIQLDGGGDISVPLQGAALALIGN